MYYNQDSYHQQEDSVKFVTLYDPFVIQTLETLQNSAAVIQTKNGNIRGIVADVKPDHVAVQSDGVTFYIRIQEIIWIMPE